MTSPGRHASGRARKSGVYVGKKNHESRREDLFYLSGSLGPP